MSEMPYVRGAGCDLCGARAPLHRVELSSASRKKRARVVYICDAHGDPSDCNRSPTSCSEARTPPHSQI